MRISDRSAGPNHSSSLCVACGRFLEQPAPPTAATKPSTRIPLEPIIICTQARGEADRDQSPYPIVSLVTNDEDAGSLMRHPSTSREAHHARTGRRRDRQPGHGTRSSVESAARKRHLSSAESSWLPHRSGSALQRDFVVASQISTAARCQSIEKLNAPAVKRREADRRTPSPCRYKSTLRQAARDLHQVIESDRRSDGPAPAGLAGFQPDRTGIRQVEGSAGERQRNEPSMVQ